MKKKCNLLFLFIFMFTISTVYVDAEDDVRPVGYYCPSGYKMIGDENKSFCCMDYVYVYRNGYITKNSDGSLAKSKSLKNKVCTYDVLSHYETKWQSGPGGGYYQSPVYTAIKSNEAKTNSSFRGCYKNTVSNEYNWGIKSAYNCLNSFQCFPDYNYSKCEKKIKESQAFEEPKEDTTISHLICKSDYLQSGCTGSSVKNLQTKLKAVQGCDIEIDGKYGPKTKECVKEFQKSNNLDVDGVAGSKTISALDEAYTKLQQGSSNTNELYYYITFDTNGGAFANGETKRNVYYNESELTMKPATIPGKSGYKFLGWYNGNILYTFGGKLTSNITLTAKYEKSTTTKYCLDGDVLDEANNQCVTIQEFSNEDDNKFYITGNNKKQTIQTKLIYTTSCPNNIYTLTYKTAEGSNNTVSCDSEDGYIRDTWRAAITCFSDTTCQSSSSSECSKTYRGTCYAAYQPGDTALDTEPDSDNTYEYNKDINNNATESPQTGGGIIALILVTLSVIGLAIFCYKAYNNKNNEII